MQRGKLVIVTMLGVAVLLAGYAWWHRYQLNRRAMRLWGQAQTRLIYPEADKVELLTLGPSGDSSDDGDRLSIGGSPFSILQREDVSRARGLLHARYALIEDASFDWQASPEKCGGQWTYALRFAQGERVVHLALDLECGRAQLVESGVDGMLVERIKLALAKYIGDHFERPAK